jgi:hypothetical protein
MFDEAILSTQLNQFITQQVKKPGSEINRKYARVVKPIHKEIVEKEADKLQEIARRSYISALKTVDRVFASGIQGSRSPSTLLARRQFRGVELKSWSSLSTRYYRHKQRYFSSSSNSFWRRSGKLKSAYASFVAAYSTRVRDSKWKTKLLNPPLRDIPEDWTYHYKIDFFFPAPPKGGHFFKDIFLDSFFEAQERQSQGQPAGGQLDVIGYLEGIGDSTRRRPFISALMANRGGSFRKKYLSEKIPLYEVLFK